MKVAEGLLLRKQLEAKVQQLHPIKEVGQRGVWEQIVQRRNVSDSVDELTISVPRVTLADITKTYDHYASQLRKLDAAIQKANWTNDLDFTEVDPPEVELPKTEEKAA